VIFPNLIVSIPVICVPNQVSTIVEAVPVEVNSSVSAPSPPLIMSVINVVEKVMTEASLNWIRSSPLPLLIIAFLAAVSPSIIISFPPEVTTVRSAATALALTLTLFVPVRFEPSIFENVFVDANVTS